MKRPIKGQMPAEMPQGPGVYVFRDIKGMPIYVGMSRNLKSRVSSYFGKQVTGKTQQMVAAARELEWIRVGSELEALILEAKLVKKYLPKYNSALRDDKSPLYVGITKEELPRVITLRKTELEGKKLRAVYGPFVDGRKVKIMLRKLRKVFPYCQHRPGKRPCVNRQIGLCKPCSSEIVNENDMERKAQLEHAYRENVRGLRGVLAGRLRRVAREIEREMRNLARAERFEEAWEKLTQLETLEYVASPRAEVGVYLKDPNFLEEVRKGELRDLKELLNRYWEALDLKRIECFDVAHLAGTSPTASMVTFIEGEADKQFYRHFRVRSRKRGSDTDAMREVLQRRRRNKTWGKPDLVIVDGGKGQVSVAAEVLGNWVPVVGLAKRFETMIIKTEKGFESVRLEDRPAKRLVQRLRDESHRFARRYHHKLVSRALMESGRKNGV